MNYSSEIEKIEIPLLMDGVFQRYGYDLREYQPDYLKEQIWMEIRSHNLSTISSFQERVLHSPQMFEKFLLSLSSAAESSKEEYRFLKGFRKSVIPGLKTYASVRLWYLGGSVEELYLTAILLEEEGLSDRTTIYFTDISQMSLARAREGAISLNRLKAIEKSYKKAGGKGKFEKYYKATKKEAHFVEILRENIAFFQHNPLVDGSFNEFNVILCRHLLGHFQMQFRAHIHALFHKSLCKLGVLGLDDKESFEKSACGKSYKAMSKDGFFFKRVG